MNYAHIWNSVAGDRLGLAWTLNGPLIGHLSWTYSVGLSMYTKPYSVTHDTNNTFIGSPLNCLIDLGFMYEQPLSERLTLTLTGKLVHSSNGYLYKPNHGLNYLQAELGLRFGPARRSYSHRPSFFGDSSFHAFGRPFLLFSSEGTNYTMQFVISSTHILVVGDILEFRSTTQTEHNACSLLMKQTSSP